MFYVKAQGQPTITEKVCTKVWKSFINAPLLDTVNRFVNLFIAHGKNSGSFSFFRLRFSYFQRSSCASAMSNGTTAIEPRGNSFPQYE